MRAGIFAADAPQDPRAIIVKVTGDALAVLRDKPLTQGQKRDKVRQIAYDTMDFQMLWRLALGQYWRGLSDDQRKQFVDAFRTHVANTYGHTTDEYTDEDIKVINDRRKATATFRCRRRSSARKTACAKMWARVDYRLRKKDDGWKIIDVTIDNVSLATNFRSQFEEIMSQGGFDQLLKDLRDKNAAADKQP